MENSDLSETSLEKSTPFVGPIFSVESHRVQLPDGALARRDFVVFPRAVVVLPVTEEGKIALVKQFRFATGETLWELPAGKCDGDEDDFLAAKRELEEETGFQSQSWEKGLKFWTTPGFTTESMTLFLARNCFPVTNPLKGDEDERINCQLFPKDRLVTMIKENTIRDAKTLLGLLFYLNGI